MDMKKMRHTNHSISNYILNMTTLRIILLSFLLTLVSVYNFQLYAQTWTNPVIITNDWPLYGIGDPFIMKFNGLYYLYPSTRDIDTGIKCWSSPDLLNWKYEGLCSTDAITKAAYAPEVHYWNGQFYMYTSPAGNGHYVLTSSSPTGPFKNVTGNLGKSIDGTIFIDDDAGMYFYHADQSGILGCPMPTPTTIGDDFSLNAQIGNGLTEGNNWTEGPTVFKRNDIYYMIYTGNHVWSKGYRIEYASSKTGPISSYTPASSQNPVILNSEGDVVGLGHGSIFVGPDLDSYYITYHNLAGDFGYGPYRHLNFDRMAWNGDKMLVLGPTSYAQQVPRMPEASDRFNRATIGTDWIIPSGGAWAVSTTPFLTQGATNATYAKAIFSPVTGIDFTAEFNVKRITSGNSSALYGAVFGYVDEQNYALVQLNSATNKLEIYLLSANSPSVPVSVALPAGFNFSALHTLRIEKQQTTLKLFLDGMKKASIQTNISAGKTGYFTHLCSADFGCIAFSNLVNGSGIFDVYKPIPGTIDAVHYNSGGEGVGYHDITPDNTGGKYIRNDNVDISDCTEGGCCISSNQTGEWYAYNVNIQSTSEYILGLRYATYMDHAQVRIWQGDKDVSGIIELPNTGGLDNWQTFSIKKLALTTGNQKIKVETVNGEFDFVSMQFSKSDTTANIVSDNFDTGFSAIWNYDEGIGYIDKGTARINGYEKRTIGNVNWSDYTVEADVKFNAGMDAGLILRVNNPALGGPGDDAQLGTDFYQGYYVAFKNGTIKLDKQNYNSVNLAVAGGSYQLNKWYHLKAVANDGNFKIYVDDMANPKINYTDNRPFLTGKAGIRVHNCDASFDNFRITTGTPPITGLNDINQNRKDLNYSLLGLSPNPVESQLLITGIPDNSQLTVYNTSGDEVMKLKETNSPVENTVLDVKNLNQGIYLIKSESGKGEIKTGRFIKITNKL